MRKPLKSLIALVIASAIGTGILKLVQARKASLIEG